MVLDGTLSLDRYHPWKQIDTPEKIRVYFILDWPQSRQKNPNFPFKHSY